MFYYIVGTYMTDLK